MPMVRRSGWDSEREEGSGMTMVLKYYELH